MNRVEINGTYYYTDREDYKTLLIDTLGIDFYNHIESLNAESLYQTKRFDSDMISYEGTIEEQRAVLNDVMDELNALQKDINESKRINKSDILKRLNKLTNDINSQL